MRVRTQTILLITPIFTLLGVAISLMVYSSERSEVHWGIEEEVSSLGVAVAEFIDGSTLTGNSDGGEVPDKADLRTLLDLGQLKYLRVYPLRDGALQKGWELGDDRFAPAGRPRGTDLEVALSDKRLAVGRVRDLESGKTIASTLAPVFDDASGSAVGVVEVTTDAGRLREQTGRIIRRCVNKTAGLTVVGFLVSIWISGFLTRRLKRLDEAARLAASGDFDHTIRLRRIREVNDLGSIFNTMNSILKDVQTKAKNELAEAEQFRKPADLAENCRRLNPVSVSRRIGENEVLFGVAGDSPSGDFAGVSEMGGAVRFFIGRVSGGDPLDATIEAGAVQFFLQRLLESESPGDAVRLAGGLFELGSCTVLEAGEDGGLRRFDSSGGGVEEKPVNGVGGPLILTSAGPEVAAKILRYVEAAGDVKGDEMSLILTGEPLTAYLVVLELEPASSGV